MSKIRSVECSLRFIFRRGIPSVKRGVGVRGRDRGRSRDLSLFKKNAVLGLGLG